MLEWIKVSDKLPSLDSDDGFIRDSEDLLFYTATGRIYKGRYRVIGCEADDLEFTWVMEGPDGYSIEDVVAWAKIDPPDFKEN